MKEISTLKRSYVRECFMAAGITAIMYLIMCAIGLIYPIGNYTILVSDMEAQYAPFLFFYRNHLLSLDPGHLISNLTYSFDMGAGKNVMSTFGYYLASPVNFIVFLFKPEWVNQFVMILMMIKLCLSSAFMCLFMHSRSSDGRSRWPVLYGVMYSFSSYTMAFMMNFMWLDGYYLLPLLLFFTDRFRKERKNGGLIVTLLLLFVSNYYIAYMAGIGAFLYLLITMIEDGELRDLRASLAKIGRYILNAVVCAMTLGVILLPVAYDTLRNADPLKQGGGSDPVRYSAIDLIDGLFLGVDGKFSDVMPSNKPFVFVSLLVTITCILYFLSPVFDRRKKIIRAVCFAGVYLFLSVVFLDRAWQVFDSPNWFYHRESFVFIPMFMLTSFDVTEKIRQVDNRTIAVGGGITYALLMIAQSFGDMKGNGEIFLTNALYIAVILVCLALLKKEKWHPEFRNMPKILPFILSLLIVFETASVNTMLSYGVATLANHYGEADQYIGSIITAEECAEAADKVGNGFRTELENISTGSASVIEMNASYYGGSNGITFFNSASNKKFHRFLKQLGFAVNYNYFAIQYNQSAPDTDAFFSIGTVAVRHPYSLARYVADDAHGTGISFYINENVLPLAFRADRGCLDFDFYSLETSPVDKDYLEFRNSWYGSMFPGAFTEDFYVTVPSDGIEAVNCTLIDRDEYYSEGGFVANVSVSSDEEEDNGNPDTLSGESEEIYDGYMHTYYRTNDVLPLILSEEITAPADGEYYYNLQAPRLLNECKIYVNGELLSSFSERTYYSTVNRLGTFAAGDKIRVTVVDDGPSFTIVGSSFAYFDMETFSASFSAIDMSEVGITEISDGFVRISSDLSDGGIILTTIPYEEGWELTIDGRKSDITVYQDALIAVDPGTGHHDIVLQFTPPLLKAGALCTIAGLAGLLCLGIMGKSKKKTHKDKSL